MAIVILGKSKCRICGEILEEGDEITAFMPFCANELDPLYFFNDDAFHEECFRSHPLCEAAEAAREAMDRIPHPYVCTACGEAIADYDDCIAFGYLTGDEANPLHEHNRSMFHHSCLMQWPELRKVRSALDRLLQSGEWKGKGLEWLLSVMRGEDDLANKAIPAVDDILLLAMLLKFFGALFVVFAAICLVHGQPWFAVAAVLGAVFFGVGRGLARFRPWAWYGAVLILVPGTAAMGALLALDSEVGFVFCYQAYVFWGFSSFVLWTLLSKGGRKRYRELVRIMAYARKHPKTAVGRAFGRR